MTYLSRKDLKKRRTRVPKSCFACRRKKVKCDKRKPYCGSCILDNKTEFCTYEVQPWEVEHAKFHIIVDDPESELERLKATIRELEKKVEYQKLLLDGRNDSNSSSSNPSRLSYTRNSFKSFDENLPSISKNFGGYNIKDSRLMYFGPTSYFSLLKKDKYSSLAFAEYSNTQERNYNEFAEHQLSEISNCLPPITNEKKLSSFITNDLPPVHIINLLLKRFFEFCYPFAPFFDETLFLNEVSHLLTTVDKKTRVKVDDHQPYSTIAILLIMLRFAYITLPLRDFYSGNLSGTSKLLVEEVVNSKTNISPAYIDCANQLLMSTGSFGRISLTSIQGILLLRVYKMYCPEDDDGWTDKGIMLGIVIQMARYHGIDRDPRFYPSSFVNTTGMLIWRKIWILLLYLDANHAFNLGARLLIPDFKEDNMNYFISHLSDLSDQHERHSVIRQFIIMTLATHSIRKILDIVREEEKNSTEDLVLQAHELSKLIDNQIRTFKQLCNHSGVVLQANSVNRAQEFVLRLDLTAKVYITYFLLATIGGAKNDIEFQNKYISLALEKALIVLRIASEYSENPASIFGPELETLVASSIWKACQKITGTICTVFFRVVKGKFSIINATNYFDSSDSSGIIKWTGIDYSSEEISIKNLLVKFKFIYHKCEELSGKFNSCYREYRCLRYIFKFIDENYSEELEQNVIQEQENRELEKSKLDFNDIDHYWIKKNDFEPMVDFEYFLSQLNSDILDPFLADTPIGMEFKNINSSID